MPIIILQRGKYKEGRFAVGIINQTRFNDYLNELKEHHLLPVALLPDFLAIPFISHQWSVWIKEGTALVRTGQQSGFSTPINNLSLLLQLSLDKWEGDKPTKIIIYQRENNFFTRRFVALDPNNKIQYAVMPNCRNYAELIESTPFNFLQGRYRSKQKIVPQQNY